MRDASAGRRTYSSQLLAAGGRELQSLGTAGDALAVAMYSSPPYDVELAALGVARLSINLTHSRVDGALDGERRRSFVARRHSLFLTPAGAAAAWRKPASSRHINIYFDPRAFSTADDDARWGPLADGFTPWLNGRLAGAGPLFDMLAEELAQPEAHRGEAVDSLARLILVRVMRARSRQMRLANPLTPALLQRVNDYVVAQLEHRLLVGDIAAVAGLPSNRFAQAFVEATGLPPHQFVLQLRLVRAQQLLRHSTHTLVEIAAACGFASQQHMTQAMRRRLGVTPARYRAGDGSTPAARGATAAAGTRVLTLAGVTC